MQILQKIIARKRNKRYNTIYFVRRSELGIDGSLNGKVGGIIMRTCNCPSCNANISIDYENRDFAFCQYCGSKIMLDDYRSIYRVIDEAKIKQAETGREIRLKELNIKEAQMKERNRLRKM